MRFPAITPLLLALFATGCVSIPPGPAPVTGFDADRYLGKWHEIARLDHSFERGLDRVSAEYAKRPDGAISVLNRGYDAKNQRWREARGVARPLGDPTVASLKVSFFRPFYGGYHVIALDPDYRWAMVAGPSRKYLWILARESRLAPEIYARLIAQARQAGFPVDTLIQVPHTP